MIDYFAILLTHALLALAVWRLVLRDELDDDGGETAARRPGRRTKRRPVARGERGDA